MTDALAQASPHTATPVTLRLGIVVVNFGSHALLEQLLVPFSERWNPSGSAGHIVVVDNFRSSPDRAAVTVLAQEHGWRLIALDDNRGFGPACNRGAEEAAVLGCEAVLFLNPDAAIEPDTAQALTGHLARYPDDVVSPRLVDTDGAVTFAGARLNRRTGRLRSSRDLAAIVVDADGSEQLHPDGDWIPWLTAACLALRTSTWKALGGFDESYFLYWEDVDFTVRAAEAGSRLVVRHDLRAVHDQGGTQGEQRGRAKSSLYYDYNCRNRLRFAARVLDRGAIGRWMVWTPLVSKEIYLRGGKRQIIESPTTLIAALRGTVVGLLLALDALVRPRRSRA